jgi:hypothetical protein
MAHLGSHPVLLSAAAFALLEVACGGAPGSPVAPSEAAALATAAPTGVVRSSADGPAQPPFDLEAQLRGEGFGLVEFRQPKDDQTIVYLDTWVRDLSPRTEYLLQRAVDPGTAGPRPDLACTSEAWLTLGAGPSPQSILTDDRGTGRASLWRQLPPALLGARFNIHFRVVEKTGGREVLRSDCYQYVVSL